MKLLIEGDQDRIISVCQEMTKIKETEKDNIVKSGLKQKSAKTIANISASMTGGMNYGDIFDAFAILYDRQGDNAVLLNIPVFVPKMVRFMLKHKLVKSFDQIFKEAGVNPVKVKFISWGDEDLKEKKGED